MITLAEKILLARKKELKGMIEFVSSTSMTITPKYTNSGVTLQYSLNGTSWTNIASGVTTPSANVIYFRGRATATKTLFTGSGGGGSNAWTFTSATNLECNGKLDRLIQDVFGDDFNISTVGSYCFSGMFYNISALIKAPSLPATSLGTNYSYAYMFQNCTGLTTAPSLPATTLGNYCYQGMFQGCTSLTTAPTLPATSFSVAAVYAYMFSGCTNLTTLPYLPALTLQTSCYQNMFQWCIKIKLSTTLTGIYDTAYRIPTTGTGTMGTSALLDMFTGTGGTFTGTPTINTTYYTENTPV